MLLLAFAAIGVYLGYLGFLVWKGREEAPGGDETGAGREKAGQHAGPAGP